MKHYKHSETGFMQTILQRLKSKPKPDDETSFKGGSVELKDWKPEFNRLETKNAFLIIITAPGLAKESILVEGKQFHLTVEGTKKSRHDQKRFFYTFELSPNVDRSRIEASYDNGLIFIRIPKLEKNRPDKYYITVK